MKCYYLIVNMNVIIKFYILLTQLLVYNYSMKENFKSVYYLFIFEILKVTLPL